MHVHDPTICALGEGPLWHPERKELFWFDILGRRLHRKGQFWQFDECVSAAGWIDHDRLLIATQTALQIFTISTGTRATLCDLESGNAATRSNDGRADPWGGFWIGTMGLQAETDAGKIYRYYRGTLRTIVDPVSISNAICFSPDRRWAYYTDTPTSLVMRQALSPEDGWPVGAPEIHIDMTGTPHKADGAVVDAAGNLWTAQWGSARVAGYDTKGKFLRSFDVPALQSSCPAFGGADFTTLFVTSAAAGLPQPEFINRPLTGQTFMMATDVPGLPESRVIV